MSIHRQKFGFQGNALDYNSLGQRPRSLIHKISRLKACVIAIVKIIITQAFSLPTFLHLIPGALPQAFIFQGVALGIFLGSMWKKPLLMVGSSLLPILVFNSCHRQNKSTSVYEGNAMTIDYKIIIGSPLKRTQDRDVKKIINDTFHEVDAIYNRWNPHSELSRLNKLKSGEKIVLTKSLENFLKLTDEIVTLTEGRFDPTIEPLQQLWKKHLTAGTTPQQQDIEDLMPAIGWGKIHYGEGIFYKEHDLTCLDLGGIAKGYCVDLLVERLNAMGYPHVFVEWGGEIRTSGQHPDKRPWNIFISRSGDPNPENAIAILSLQDQAIATSGDYLQQWKIKDLQNDMELTYFHIINPQTGAPLIASQDSIGSVSVLAPTCALADGLATAAMLFPSVQEAERWIEQIKLKLNGLKFWIEKNN